ncbi:hypothetical protein [Streptomyces sp. CMB-StM0423]|uniref:hypothetical protein n=1 Tax=Streptomyces sp. CMB-StM0423 TaxID=2059884 RepID=UPI000C700AC6|nr:hypothetical protein [Streptomyces sp. CMB-StM0423]AUH43722.1 hypothetical protein CXR04_29305 [Streptomyces sp. CMB-StM0423]
MLRVVNRILLAVTGLLVAGAGIAVLFAGLDLPRPGFAPYAGGSGDVLLSRDTRMQWRDDGWWWPTVVGGLSLLVLCCGWWLVAQLRRARLGEVVVDTGGALASGAPDASGADGGKEGDWASATDPDADGAESGGPGTLTLPTAPQALLRGSALEEVLAEEAGALAGVERARVTLTGRRTAPRASFGVLLGPGAHPAAAVDHIEERALAPARASVGLARLPAEIRFRPAKHRPERVS